MRVELEIATGSVNATGWVHLIDHPHVGPAHALNEWHFLVWHHTVVLIGVLFELKYTLLLLAR